LLVIPLHRAPTWANVPWVTIALILVNVFVFSVLQAADVRVRQNALDWYVEQDLQRWEFPAYREWLAAHGGSEGRGEAFAFFADDAPRMAAQVLQTDEAFLSELRATQLDPSIDAHAQWRERRSEFDRLWGRMFTERWMIRFSDFDPSRMFGAMFLHGGIGHLVGNMLFLALIGLLVEGALGPVLFLVVYLIGGMGSAAISLLWRMGETGGALGASGAIAALMGAYCVLWGLRKVRFFWWFFVVFDYVKAPALILLPVWLGWELLNLAFNHDSNVGFDAHAGGLAAGALLASGILVLGWERREFLDEDIVEDARTEREQALKRAEEHIGRLQISAARALLEPMAEARPDDFEVRDALYRCACLEPGRPQRRDAAREVLTLAPRTAAEVRRQKAILEEMMRAEPDRLPLLPTQAVAMLRRWPAIGGGVDAARHLGAWAARAPATPGLRAACLGVARDLIARNEVDPARMLLDRVVSIWPDSDDAGKARTLLSMIG